VEIGFRFKATQIVDTTTWSKYGIEAKDEHENGGKP
jgi:hypothetical protein